MTDITELAQSLKAAAEKATPGNWRAFQYHDGRCGVGGGNHDEIMVCEHISKKRPHDALFIAMANPANVLALVEALEKAQGMETYWKTQCRGITDHCEELQARIAELESRTVKLPDDEDGQAYGFGKWANGKLPATAGTMTIAYCEDAWRAAFEVFSSTAGIKVEAE
ncbi:ead/Ea22-like family protein [Klebsiella variicola]|uniref:ead/Ea22-like family protein n=1 Tax=Klebsiella variicola TaxID=244366 RepID=UPI001E56BD5E|nr:ead/Ea22-like family protein [Klebsiella variicola]MCE0520213.1 ead/Ea22-like family protein [Klebsiella variicola]